MVAVIHRFAHVDPGNTKSNMWTEMMFELVGKLSNIVGIDGATGGQRLLGRLDQNARLTRSVPSGFTIVDTHLLEAKADIECVLLF